MYQDRDSSSDKNGTEVSTKVMTNSTLQNVLLMTLKVVIENGADVTGMIMTGNSAQLSSGVIVLETRLGHTLICTENLVGSLISSAEVIEGDRCNNMHAISLHLMNFVVDKLWELEAIGIYDPWENWPLARVLKLLPGKKCKVWAVKLRTENGAQRLIGIQDTNLEKDADASMDPHSISDVPQHRAEIP
ncbi:hypothetical protein HNY73_011244 [Argiope bruennichi]|uniref:Uncharacterized protein n=1 Tax=Argiope bruennichi TaxID=94029 RepID=A0A8T0F3H5_ARGBR|nr:hypothetical protein HNY73_011244 [Argiope bruennichi]